MKPKSLIVPFLLFISPAWILPAQQARFSKEDLIAETREIVRILETGHPDPYLYGGGKIAFHRRFQGVLEAIPEGGMDADAYATLLLPFLAAIGDGHTYLIPPSWDKESGVAFPLRLTVIENSLVVTGVRSPALKSLLNARLEAVENIPLAELAEREKGILAAENVYHNLRRLKASLASLERLKILLPEWKDRGALTMRFILENGRTVDQRFALTRAAEGALITNPSRVDLPSTERADFAWRFMDAGRQTALLRIDDMQTYRECHEHWRFYGHSYEDLARATYERFHGRKAPADLNQVIDALPSATDCFRDLVRAMKEAGTTNLIIDLRKCPGGISNITEMLMYFIFGRDKTVDVLSRSYQVRKHSEAYYQYAPGEKFDPKNGTRPIPLTINDYDLLEEKNSMAGADLEERRAALRRDLDDMASHMPTFNREYIRGEYEAFFTPPHLIVLSEAETFSSAFWMLQCFVQGGAKLVGVPSGQAPNTFSDQNPYELPRTKLTLYMTCKYSVALPKLAPEERFIKPDHELTYDLLKSYGFDPNAAVLLAMDVLAGRAGEKANR